jgi:hypothetical protein
VRRVACCRFEARRMMFVKYEFSSWFRALELLHGPAEPRSGEPGSLEGRGQTGVVVGDDEGSGPAGSTHSICPDRTCAARGGEHPPPPRIRSAPAGIQHTSDHPLARLLGRQSVLRPVYRPQVRLTERHQQGTGRKGRRTPSNDLTDRSWACHRRRAMHPHPARGLPAVSERPTHAATAVSVRPTSPSSQKDSSGKPR